MVMKYNPSLILIQLIHKWFFFQAHVVDIALDLFRGWEIIIN